MYRLIESIATPGLLTSAILSGSVNSLDDKPQQLGGKSGMGESLAFFAKQKEI